MSGPARRVMTVDEFVVWDDGTDTRYELIGGEPVAMAPSPNRGALTIAIAVQIAARLCAHPAGWFPKPASGWPTAATAGSRLIWR